MKSFNKMIAAFLVVFSLSAGAVVSFDKKAFMAAKSDERIKMVETLYKDSADFAEMINATGVGSDNQFRSFMDNNGNLVNKDGAVKFLLDEYVKQNPTIMKRVLSNKVVKYGLPVVAVAGAAGLGVLAYNKRAALKNGVVVAKDIVVNIGKTGYSNGLWLCSAVYGKVADCFKGACSGLKNRFWTKKAEEVKQPAVQSEEVKQPAVQSNVNDHLGSYC